MNIRFADNNDLARWDEYVQTHPLASPYHLFAWKRAVEEAYGHKTYYLLAEDNGLVTGVLPLMYLKLPLISGELVSLPYCDIGGILAKDDLTLERLISGSVDLARRLKAKYISLRGQTYSSQIDHLNVKVHVQSHKVRMLMDIPGSSGILWEGFRSKLRSQIRKAEKNGLIFKWGDSNDLDDFYMVFSCNMRDIGSPVHSKELFFRILHHYGKNIRMGMVFCDRVPIGAGIILSMNNTISIPWASTLQDYKNLSPNMLLYWNFLKYAADNGYTTFDFGRSTPDEGTYHFKLQWGAKPAVLNWSYIIMNSKKMAFAQTSAIKRDSMARLWRNLPLSLANTIGPVIRKHISL